MNILVTNDDGIFAEGIRTLVEELCKIARVVVVAPDREQSAVGTAVTLWQPLRARKLPSLAPGVATYSVDGTPSDSVILGLRRLAGDGVDMVVSGINEGHNLGDDVHISGTVSGALQGYLHGYPSIAVSTARDNTRHLAAGARVAAFLARKVGSGSLPSGLFLNVNLPNLPLEEIRGVRITRLAHESHINTVEEGEDGQGQYFQLVRRRLDGSAPRDTDIEVIDCQGLSITPLVTNLNCEPSSPVLQELCADLSRTLTASGELI